VSVLGFRKRKGSLEGDPHLFFFNRHFGFVLRPARTALAHDPYAPGLHHFCLRVNDAISVDRAARELRALGVDASEPRLCPEYAPDYYATFFSDPDGIRLEITNFREERRRRMFDWESESP
jgi:catechol 2,3-dioxygenase-like lactoylglutathione lyase family enzyme